MPLAVPVLLVILGLPALVLGALWLRLRTKERLKDRFLSAVREDLRAAGAEFLDPSVFRWNGRGGTVEASSNPLLGRGFSLRMAAWSDTIHECELRSGRPVPPEFEAFGPLLSRWDSAGKMVIDCYAAGVTRDPSVSQDVRRLLELSTLPLAKSWTGGTFTYREGFELKMPQWHWRHDLRRRLPREVHRYCLSYWREGPLLNPGLMKVLWDLAGVGRKFILTDSEDLRFLEYGFGREHLSRQGALVELAKPEMAVAADLRTDGEFFHGFLAAPDRPSGFDEPIPRYRIHEAALGALPGCAFYARRLYDDECSWFSGEYEIVSASALDVRGAIHRVSGEMQAQLLELDRRFHKRLVVPLDF